jgi:hypothetical protein
MEETIEKLKAGNYGSILNLDGWDDGSFVTDYGIVSLMTDHKK